MRGRLSLDVRRSSRAAPGGPYNDDGQRPPFHTLVGNTARSQLDLTSGVQTQEPSSSKFEIWKRKGKALLHVGAKNGEGYARRPSRSPSASRAASETVVEDRQAVNSDSLANNLAHRTSISTPNAFDTTAVSPTRSTRCSSEGQISLFDNRASWNRSTESPASSLAAVQDFANVEQIVRVTHAKPAVEMTGRPEEGIDPRMFRVMRLLICLRC